MRRYFASQNFSAILDDGTTPKNWGQLRKAILDSSDKKDNPGTVMANKDKDNHNSNNQDKDKNKDKNNNGKDNGSRDSNGNGSGNNK